MVLRFLKGWKPKRKEKREEKEQWMEQVDEACSGHLSEEFLVLPEASSSSEMKRTPRVKRLSQRRISVAPSVLKTGELVDLADEKLEKDTEKAEQFTSKYACPGRNILGTDTVTTIAEECDPIVAIRNNLPPDPLLNTPFGTRRMTYADYTASGRSLHFVEEYIQRVVHPMYANTHTETSASGLQTTHSREEARAIIMKSLKADPAHYSLIFTGTGVTGAIWKLIALLGIHCPPQLQQYLKVDEIERPLILCSQSEHHSNELMWRETIADVIAIPADETGALNLTILRKILEESRDKYKVIIGSFSSGSNVTGLITPPGPVAALMHEYGGFCCFDYAGAGPYVDMNMSGNDDIPKSYLDAIYISPHKFVGGPGTPGLLCIRRDFANCRKGMDLPPTIAGGGTVKMVWPSTAGEEADMEANRVYEDLLHAREEAGTPGIVEAIRCGLAFHVRDLVGPKRIEELEGAYAAEAVRRLQAADVWVMGDTFSSITSEHRLSITSFNVWCKPKDIDAIGNNISDCGILSHPQSGKPLLLHPHFVAALLNDVYGIQARSGCACAGPLSFRLFGPRYPFMTEEAIQTVVSLAEDDFHCLKPGFCRVNFNYFIDRDEFNFIVEAIEQIAEYGWKLLPLYALCLKTGQYWYNGVVSSDDSTNELVSFNRFDAVRNLTELNFEKDNTVSWNECIFSKENRNKYLKEAMVIYDSAPSLVRKMLFRYRDTRRKDVAFPEKLQKYRFFALGSEVLPYLGIAEEEMKASQLTELAKDAELNPMVTAFPKHETANPWFTWDRPRG